jgi:hypothetical protein
MVVTPCYKLLGREGRAPGDVLYGGLSSGFERHSTAMHALYGLAAQKAQEETMRAARPPLIVIAALCGLSLLTAGCSGVLEGDPRAGLSCIDDSPECVDQRQTTLKSMLADQDRKWVKEPATPKAHASGVRLFAFRAKKGELSCEELVYGRREADDVKKSLKGSSDLTPAQVSRASLFAAEVSKELTVEIKKRRCKT